MTTPAAAPGSRLSATNEASAAASSPAPDAPSPVITHLPVTPVIMTDPPGIAIQFTTMIATWAWP
jgi:hypothetical protein